jgi:hypothetical protein
MTWRYNNSIDGTTATIWCHNPKCSHRGPLNLEALKRRLGGQHGMLLDEIKHGLARSKCGGKEMGMTRHHNTKGKVPAGRR